MTETQFAGLENTASPRGWRFSRIEEVFLAALLLTMLAIPTMEIALRLAGWRGITGGTTIVQHCTLALSMIGAAAAARDRRLLSMGTAAFLPVWLKPFAAKVSAIGAAAVAGLLCLASLRFVLIEQGAGKLLVGHLPVWVAESVLPLGFALIALRLLAMSSEHGWIRVIGFVCVAAVMAAGATVESPSRAAVASAIALLVIVAAFGAPIFSVIGGAAIVAFIATDLPIVSLTVSHYSLVVNPSLPAIPLFTLAGYVLAEGGASRRLVRLFDALVGGVRGGAGAVTALACAFFTTFTGGSGVTILALGGLLLPMLRQARYSERDSLGLIAGAGALGILFPPCLPLILYAIAANVDIHELFVAGIGPGMLLLVLTIGLARIQQPPGDEKRSFDRREVAKAAWDAKWELLLPVVALGVLFAGIATPVEAAAVTAMYAILAEVVIHRDFGGPSRLAAVFRECAVLVGGILLILGVALGLTAFLIDAEVPQHAVAWATASIASPFVFLLLLNLFLIAVGAMIDIYSAILVVVPLIVPLGAAFGIDPVHLGLIFLTNLELGYLIPPVGENLFIAAYRFNRPVGELARAVLPMVGILLVGVVLVTYFPALWLWPLRLMR
ncbi:MAG: TRAP transporter large permease subunit [Thermoanaerobaculia bacterium]|nr:TRAP transporter large permease subunit [Thermoanaerobaculia bacterium]